MSEGELSRRGMLAATGVLASGAMVNLLPGVAFAEPATGEGTQTQTVTGTFAPNIEDWFYLPVKVPQGVNQIDVYSDGRRTPDQLVTDARGAGLDFIVSTDHNTSSSTLQWGDHAQLRQRDRSRDHPGGGVGDPDVEHLAGADEVVERLDHLLGRRDELSIEDVADYQVMRFETMPKQFHETWIPSRTPNGRTIRHRPFSERSLGDRGRMTSELLYLVATGRIVGGGDSVPGRSVRRG